MRLFVAGTLVLFSGICTSGIAQEPSRYMGGPVDLVEAPNGAIVNAATLEVSSKIQYLEPTVEEVADGVWSIGGYSLANTTVIETEDGLIVYDTGDTREEGEHIREAIESKISERSSSKKLTQKRLKDGPLFGPELKQVVSL